MADVESGHCYEVLRKENYANEHEEYTAQLGSGAADDRFGDGPEQYTGPDCHSQTWLEYEQL
jgi:hypothetical protein